MRGMVSSLGAGGRALRLGLVLLWLVGVGLAGPLGAWGGEDAKPPAPAEGASPGQTSAPEKKPEQKKAPKAPVEEKKKSESPTPTLTVTVTATKSEKDIYEVPHTVNVVDQEEISERLQVPSFVDVFKEKPGVMVQRTAQGQGSPFIRGFTGFHNVLLIDGVRFNNSILRFGPNQYWATIDPLSVARVELVQGPGSALYGSDAVGGTVNVLTKSTDTWSDKTEVGGLAYYRFSGAERTNIGHVEFKGSHKDKVGFLVSGSFKDHDDFRAGGGTGIVENSGFEEYGVDAKVQYRPTNNQELTFLVQRYHQEEVPRTEKTVFAKAFEGTKVGSEFRRETDQDRLLAYLKYHVDGLGSFIEEAEATVSYQNTKQERFRKRANLRTDNQEIEVNTFGAQAQFKSGTPIGKMTYGIDYYHDEVDTARKDFNADGSLRSIRIQGPVADDSSYDLLGIYAQNEVSAFDDYVTFTAAGRFTYAQVQGGRIQDPVSGNEFSAGNHWSRATGSLRILVRPDKDRGDHWHVFGGVSQAFRAPNIADMTTFDATSAREVPTSGLKPESYVTSEIGAKARYPTFGLSTTFFYTHINNQIVQSPNGNIVAGTPDVIKTNDGAGYSQGVEFAGHWDFYKDFTLWGNVTWTESEVDQFEFNAAGRGFRHRKPSSRIVPVMSHMGIKYEPKGDGRHWWVELHADVFSDADRLALRDRTDTRRIPPGGTSGFGVFGIRGGAKLLDDKLTISGAIENLANEDYRIHGSGQNMPGLNFIMSIGYRW